MNYPRQHGESALSQALVERAKSGEAQAFREILELTHAPIYRVVFRLLHSDADAQEVVQETYVRAWRSIASLRDAQLAMGWLYTIARNLARDQLRWRIRRREDSPEEHASEDPQCGSPRVESRASPESAASSKEQAHWIARALDNLPDKLRLTLVLREVDEMSYEEIALALGIPSGTVESRLHRARKAMLHYFSKHQREIGGLFHE